ncbi:NAD(P)-dependent oxidoreductase [Nocardia aurantiaca]|uniref:NAD(P)-dependent oxidoreductase n=1 Tax=Nocardia aurantiaca TaxID=2675850 RepID=A0A6I3KV91_9NOCA|nr:NAD(P)-binding domain-containing protein [Nocardia aurantiaca]MTE14733.1 NAD(P)-dependent oxidoreductase [Nocardia aurantiaca]
MSEIRSASPHLRSVSVIGLGPMGRAMVKAFLTAGVEVTVWNRSPEKAAAMAELGAKKAATVAEAVDANEVIVVSLTHYAAMYDVLEPVTDHLPGKIIANLSSDSPQRTRAGASWVRSHGAQFLSGGCMTVSDDIEHPASYIFYSGPRPTFDACAELLRPLSPQEYLGADDGLAQVYYQALLTVFHPWMLAVDQAFALIANSGNEIDHFLPYALRAQAPYADFMTGFAATAKTGGWGDLANLRMMDAGARHVIEASEDAGVDATLIHAAQALWRKAIDASVAAGHPVPIHRVLRGDVV